MKTRRLVCVVLLIFWVAAFYCLYVDQENSIMKKTVLFEVGWTVYLVETFGRAVLMIYIFGSIILQATTLVSKKRPKLVFYEGRSVLFGIFLILITVSIVLSPRPESDGSSARELTRWLWFGALFGTFLYDLIEIMIGQSNKKAPGIIGADEGGGS